jgi:hypothetical protein
MNTKNIIIYVPIKHEINNGEIDNCTIIYVVMFWNWQLHYMCLCFVIDNCIFMCMWCSMTIALSCA